MGSGVLFFAEEEPGEQDKDELLHMCIAIAGHEITSIGQVYLNDEPIESYGQYASYELHNNRQVADPYLLANCPSWDSTMIGKNIAFVRVTLKFSADKFPNGIPNIKMVKRGYKVYDPRTGKTAWSANSALVYLHFLKTFCGVADSDVLVEQFKSCANICDELVATAAGSGFRYRTHGEFDFNESRVKVMEAILLSCAGDRVYTGGKHGLMVGAYQGPATLELHSRQICGDVQITPETSERDRFNTYRGKFINASQKFIQSDFPPVSVAEWVAEDGREITKDIDFRFVTDEYQAQRICAMKMRRARVGAILQVPMNYSGFAYRPGKNVKVFIPELQIDGVEYKVDSWSFNVQGGVKLILIQDSPQMYGDIPGQAVVNPPLTNLPSSGPPAPSNLRYTAKPVGDIVQGVLQWGNFGTQVVDNIVNVYKAGALQYSVRTPANECVLTGLAAGSYEARVQAIAANGVGSSISTLVFTIDVPATPTSVSVIPDNWSLQLIPKFQNQLSFGTICEFFWSTVNLTLNQVEAQATNLGMGATLTHSGLQPDTTYYYWIRSINAYGKSSFFALTAKTTYDIGSIVDALDGEIGAEHLRQDLRTRIDDNVAATQTVQKTVADLDGKIRASWYTKAQVNGVGGGFGLEVVMQPDGTRLASFVVDADVFAILSRGVGATSKRHPFVVKNGTVYMNHAMMDTAEIGNVIAKYINVQHLKGSLIEGGSFRGGDLWLGENATGQFGAYGKKWNAGIDSRGRIYGSDVYFSNGTFQGNVLANSGTMYNVTIKENCNVLGTIYANRIVGAIDSSTVKYFNPFGPVMHSVDVVSATYIEAYSSPRTLTIFTGVAVRVTRQARDTAERFISCQIQALIGGAVVGSANFEARIPFSSTPTPLQTVTSSAPLVSCTIHQSQRPTVSIRVLVLSQNAGGDSGVFSTSHSATFSTKVTGTDQVS
jgi:hypothetical protein